MRKVFWLSLLVALGVGLPAVAAIGTGYSLFGDATYVMPGHNSNRAVNLTSNSTLPNGYSGIDFGVPAGVATISDQCGREERIRLPWPAAEL